MYESSKYFSQLAECEDLQCMLKEINSAVENLANNEFKSYGLSHYQYDLNHAVEELGIDKELLDQLLVECITQVLSASNTLLNHVHELKENPNQITLQNLRDLAHKNLGAVKNLRIKNDEIFLTNIMKLDDLDAIQSNIEGLIACSVLLNPEESFKALKTFQTQTL